MVTCESFLRMPVVVVAVVEVVELVEVGDRLGFLSNDSANSTEGGTRKLCFNNKSGEICRLDKSETEDGVANFPSRTSDRV